MREFDHLTYVIMRLQNMILKMKRKPDHVSIIADRLEYYLNERELLKQSSTITDNEYITLTIY